MAKYLNFFDTRASHDNAYKTNSNKFSTPWTSHVQRTIPGTRYFVSYNKYLEASSSSVSFNSKSGTTGVDIDGICAWSASCDNPWFNVSPTANTSGASILTITVAENEGGARKGVITLTSSKGLTKTIEVTQMEEISGIPSIIWVDDFPDGTDDYNCGGPYITPYDPNFVGCFYEYPSFDEYLDDYMEDPESFGSNCFIFKGKFNYDGTIYFLYEHTPTDSQDTIRYGLLPTGSSYETLYINSIESNHANHVDAFDYILNTDKVEYFHTTGGDSSYKLVKVETPIYPQTSTVSEIYIDDFPDEKLRDKGYHDAQEFIDDDYLPNGMPGVNLFQYVENMDYNGESYFLYECEDAGLYGLMPQYYSFEYLSDKTITYDSTNRFEPFSYIFNTDDFTEEPYDTGGNESYVLVDIVE